MKLAIRNKKSGEILTAKDMNKIQFCNGYAIYLGGIVVSYWDPGYMGGESTRQLEPYWEAVAIDDETGIVHTLSN